MSIINLNGAISITQTPLHRAMTYALQVLVTSQRMHYQRTYCHSIPSRSSIFILRKRYLGPAQRSTASESEGYDSVLIHDDALPVFQRAMWTQSHSVV